MTMTCPYRRLKELFRITWQAFTETTGEPFWELLAAVLPDGGIGPQMDAFHAALQENTPEHIVAAYLDKDKVETAMLCLRWFVLGLLLKVNFFESTVIKRRMVDGMIFNDRYLRERVTAEAKQV